MNKPLKDLLGIRLSTTLLAMKRYLLAEFEKAGVAISFEEWMNLLPLLGHSACTQNDLARILGKDKTTISRMVSGWEKKGLISRVRSTTDQRAVNLVLTKKTLKLHAQAQPLIENADKVFSQDLTQEELMNLVYLLGKIKTSTSS